MQMQSICHIFQTKIAKQCVSRLISDTIENTHFSFNSNKVLIRRVSLRDTIIVLSSMLHFFKGCSWSKFNQAEPKSIAHSVVIHLMKQHKMIHSSNLPVYLEIVLDQQHIRLVSMYYISSCLASLKDSLGWKDKNLQLYVFLSINLRKVLPT